MKISNFRFSIDHAPDGGCVLTLQHGGDRYIMDLSPEQRRSLGVNLLDATLASVGDGGAEDGAPES